MLSPDSRSLYTGAVTPPPGYVFDQAIATTYSLDPDTLLLLSVHLALAQRPSTDQVDPIRLLESLRRLSGRLSVYVDRDGIKDSFWKQSALRFTRTHDRAGRSAERRGIPSQDMGASFHSA